VNERTRVLAHVVVVLRIKNIGTIGDRGKALAGNVSQSIPYIIIVVGYKIVEAKEDNGCNAHYQCNSSVLSFAIGFHHSTIGCVSYIREQCM
jgi:hypothetical protein